jgi:cobalt-zinc-cadmium efflux system protein
VPTLPLAPTTTTRTQRNYPQAVPANEHATITVMAHHHHGHVHTDDTRRLTVALVLILGLMVVEVVAGVLASSLALLSDAAHMLTDAGAIALALFAARLARRPAQGRFTFGFRRAEILSAQLNGATLVALAVVIVWEGIRRLGDPPEVEGLAVLVVAIVGIAVNLAAVLITGFSRADGIAALFVAALMLRSGYGLLRDSGRVLLEAAPHGLDPEEIGNLLAAQDHVVEVHDLHVWEVTSGFPAISAHVTVRAGCDTQAHRRELADLLRERFQISHSTLQVETRHEGPLTIEPLERGTGT